MLLVGLVVAISHSIPAARSEDWCWVRPSCRRLSIPSARGQLCWQLSLLGSALSSMATSRASQPTRPACALSWRGTALPHQRGPQGLARHSPPYWRSQLLTSECWPSSLKRAHDITRTPRGQGGGPRARGLTRGRRYRAARFRYSRAPCSLAPWSDVPAALALGAYTSFGFVPELSGQFSPATALRRLQPTGRQGRAARPAPSRKWRSRTTTRRATVREIKTRASCVDYLSGGSERRWAAIPARSAGGHRRGLPRARPRRHLFVPSSENARVTWLSRSRSRAKTTKTRSHASSSATPPSSAAHT